MESREAQISAVAALDEPTRRRLYDYVVRQPEPVSRDDAAAALELPRTTAAFHLDRLVDEGLLDVVFQRLTGRTGPGAGRPTKLYQRSDQHVTVSLPQRRYDLAGRLLTSVLTSWAENSAAQPAVLLAIRIPERPYWARLRHTVSNRASKAATSRSPTARSTRWRRTTTNWCAE